MSARPTLHFRCVKVAHHEKRTNRYNEAEERVEHVVEVQFDCVEAQQATRGPDPYSSLMHGYLALTLHAEQFRELGYEVGKVYELAPT